MLQSIKEIAHIPMLQRITPMDLVEEILVGIIPLIGVLWEKEKNKNFWIYQINYISLYQH